MSGYERCLIRYWENFESFHSNIINNVVKNDYWTLRPGKHQKFNLEREEIVFH
jgi:hypothetical protein